MDRDQAEAARRERFTQPLGHARGDAGRPSGLFGQDQIARHRLARVGYRQFAPLAFVDGLQPQPIAFRMQHAEHELLRPLQPLHGVSNEAASRFLGAREDAIADAQRRALAAPLHHAQPGRRRIAVPALGHGESLALLADVHDPQHRDFRHPAHFMESTAGSAVDESLVRHVLQQGLERDLVRAVQAERTRDLALAGGRVRIADKIEDLLAARKAGHGAAGHPADIHQMVAEASRRPEMHEMIITAAVSREATPAPALEEVDLAAPLVDEVRVRIVATGICHTDLAVHAGTGLPTPRPIVLGHEGAGIVEQVGAGVTTLAIGDHVVLSGGSCGQCGACLSARPTYCRDTIRLSFGGARADGSSPISRDGHPIAAAFFQQSSFATHAVAPARSAVRVPKDLPLHLLGPLGCGFITGAGAILEAFRLRPGHAIVVFGVGGVGLAAVMAARLAGARRIVAVDLDRGRLDQALELGATDAILSNSGTGEALRAILPDGFDFSFNTTNVAAVYEETVNCLGMEGTAGFVTRPSAAWAPSIGRLLAGGRKLQGILGGSAAPQLFIPLMIDYWRQGRFPFDRLIEPFAFADIGRAWEAARTGTAIKPVLMMG